MTKCFVVARLRVEEEEAIGDDRGVEALLLKVKLLKLECT